LPEISASRVFIVPRFISEGYFSDEVIPRELGFGELSTLNPVKGRGPDGALRPQHSTIYYCPPVGTHDSMTRVLLARANGIVAQFPFPRAPNPQDITLFIAGHGTEKNENSRKVIEHHRASPIIPRWRKRNTWWCRFSSVMVCTHRRTFRFCSARRNGLSNNVWPPGSRRGVIRRKKTASWSGIRLPSAANRTWPT
jgi:hypothetical protein